MLWLLVAGLVLWVWSKAGIRKEVPKVPALTSATRREFHKRFLEEAKNVDWRGIKPVLALAVADLESGAGTGYIARSTNNVFSLTKRSDWTGPVWKSDKGNPLTFEKYASLRQAIQEWVYWLSKKPHVKRAYAAAVAGDFKAFAAELQKIGYAADAPDYAARLENIRKGILV